MVTQLKKEMSRTPHTKPKDDSYLRLRYTRYADDFLIGIVGPRNLAVRVKRIVGEYLRIHLKLTMNESKTQITSAEDRVPFLGYLIRKAPRRVYKKRLKTLGRTIKTMGSRSKPILLMDTNKVIKRMERANFCTKGGEPRPNFRLFYHHPQSFSVDRANSILRGLAKYYHLANNKKEGITRIAYIIRFSLAKTLAAKHKLGTMRQVFKRAGRDLSNPIDSKKVEGTTDQKLIADSKGSLRPKPMKIIYSRSNEITKPDLEPFVDKRRKPMHLENPLAKLA